MSGLALSLLDLETDSPVCFEAEDYQRRPGKWCAGCGDFGALNAVKRLLAKEQLQPDRMVGLRLGYRLLQPLSPLC